MLDVSLALDAATRCNGAIVRSVVLSTNDHKILCIMMCHVESVDLAPGPVLFSVLLAHYRSSRHTILTLLAYALEDILRIESCNFGLQCNNNMIVNFVNMQCH